jgi:hypothetical protein
MGENDSSLAQSLNNVHEKVNSLYADVEAGLRIEDAKWGEATKVIDDSEKIVAALQTPRDTKDEIDKLVNVVKQ